MKCPVCDHELAEGIAFCSECGTKINETENNNEFVIPNSESGSTNRYKHPIKTRNIGMCIVLTLLTCGLYGLYWMICLNDEINLISNNEKDTSGIMVFVFTLLTCGIYGWFWMWKTGEKVDEIKGSTNSNIAYLILSIFGLGLVSYALMQDTLNKYAN